MTCQEENSTITDIFKLPTDDGFNGLGGAIRLLINEAMRLERQVYLGADPYERSEDRPGCRCLKTVDIGMDTICPGGCFYCYVTTSTERAMKNHEIHDKKVTMMR